MWAFIFRRLFTLIPLLFGVSLLVSLLMYVSPGDFLTQARASKDVAPEVIQQMEMQLGLVDAEGNATPWFVQYGHWLANVSPLKYGPWVGDSERGIFWGRPYFGESWAYKIEVFDLLMQRVPATFILSLTSILFAWSIAIPLGILAAMYKDSIFDRVSAFLAYAALSIPEFFLAILAVYFAAITGWFPEGGRSSVESEFYPLGLQLLDYVHHLILPTIVLGIGGVAGTMRVMRANFIDCVRAEYVTTARAKGLGERVIMFVHVLRNAINPLITSLGYAFASLLSGALLVENVMNYPGLGQLIFDALIREDQFVVMAGILVGVTMLVFGNLLADLVLGWVDPRIRLEDSEGSAKHKAQSYRSLLFLVLFGIIGAEIICELFFPSVLGFLLQVMQWVGLLLVAFVALACLCMMLYLLFVLVKRLLVPVMKRFSGAVALSVLFVLYGLACLAPFLAPYSVSEQNLKTPFHPPSQLVFEADGLKVQLMERSQKGVAEYQASGVLAGIEFFSETEPYTILGCIPLKHKFFQLDLEDSNARIYLLGSDATGRDIFSRLLYGAQISLSIGLIGISITLVLGFLVGSVAGYYGGWIDFVAMRFVELLMSIPGLYLLLALRSAFSRPELSPVQVYTIIVVILSVIGWAGTARIIRGMTLSLRKQAFVEAAESFGVPVYLTLIRHILPNIASYLLVAATLSIPGYILAEAALSFLGLGISEPSASWGLMLRQSQGNMIVFFMNFWWMLLPGLAIFMTVVAYNILGDVLRDIVDPKMKL